MRWPLTTSSRNPSQGFGVPWINNLKKQHTGIDLPAKAGAQVFACADGTVSKTGSLGKDPSGVDYGKFILLQHESDNLVSCYLHTDPQAIEGARIVEGGVLGVVKDLKANSHLHFGIWKGQRNQITPRGALPFPKFVGTVGPFFDDPAFPSSFVDPLSFTYGVDQTPLAIPTFEFPIKRDLSKGCVDGPDVKVLQQLLNKDPQTRIAMSGPGSPGQESLSFGGLTEKAVQRFQEKYAIATPGQPGYGVVGPRTREKLREIFRTL